MKSDNEKLNKWLNHLNTREKEDLMKDNLEKSSAWTEEVIIPQIVFEKLTSIEKQAWKPCKVADIYSAEDVKTLFGVEPDKLNKCFSKKFYKLSKEELEEWEKIGRDINTELPIDDVLIIFTQ